MPAQVVGRFQQRTKGCGIESTDHEVSCGLSNPGPFLLLDLAIERVGRALKDVPAYSQVVITRYRVKRQRFFISP